MKKFLRRYPFSDERVQLVEGFSVYDGNLKDEPDTPHKGIDYVLIQDGHYVGFDVVSMHAGTASWGRSKSWGLFVAICAGASVGRCQTIYAHLRTVNPKISQIGSGKRRRGLRIPAGFHLGRAGITGWTNRLTQLHIELHRILADGTIEKCDPYGIYDRRRSGKYPQPGKSLHGIPHLWTADMPPR